MELADRVPGLSLDATKVSLPAAGAAASVSGTGLYTQARFSFDGTVGVPEHLTARFSTPVDLSAHVGMKDIKACRAE